MTGRSYNGVVHTLAKQEVEMVVALSGAILCVCACFFFFFTFKKEGIMLVYLRL